MPKLHVELDGPGLTECVILKDGQPQTQVTSLLVHLDANTRDQVISIGSLAILDGDMFESNVAHTIRKMTINLEYEEV
jgi:hypothetical protein